MKGGKVVTESLWGGMCGCSSSRSNPKFKKCTHAKVSETSRLFNQVKAVYKFVPPLVPDDN